MSSFIGSISTRYCFPGIRVAAPVFELLLRWNGQARSSDHAGVQARVAATPLDGKYSEQR